MGPMLCEPGVKSFIGNTLKKTRIFKDKWINIIFNIGMCLLFIIMVGGFLLYKYKGRPTYTQLEEKQRKKHEYIISKLQTLSAIKNKNTLITDLPAWDHNIT